MPVGPHILCDEATSQSAPSARTSTGMLGTLWHASTSSLPPTCTIPAAQGVIAYTGSYGSCKDRHKGLTGHLYNATSAKVRGQDINTHTYTQLV